MAPLGPVEALVRRTLFLKLRVTPPPVSLGHSLDIYSQIGSRLAPDGRLIYYNQDMCPVTKQRLESLRILVEDFGRTEKNGMPEVSLVGPHAAPGPRTPLEERLLELQTAMTVGDSDVSLVFATREPDVILKLRGMVSNGAEQAQPDLAGQT